MNGLYVSIIFDLNVAPTITSMGRSLISSAIMCFEMFLGNNVKFSSLNDVLVFIDNVRRERPKWQYDDYKILDQEGFVDVNEVFTKIMLNCGYKYIPTESDMDIVYDILKNCNQVELNRLFYKNNLYSFMDNSICRNLMISIFTNMDIPYVEPMKPPTKIVPQLTQLKDLLMEYVFYNYMIFDRMDRNKNMIKTISLVSDTDSSFVSLDSWYNYNAAYLKNYDSPIMHQSIDLYQLFEKEAKEDDYWWKDGETPEWYNCVDKRPVFNKIPVDEWGDPKDKSVFNVFSEVEPDEDYDFFNEEIITTRAMINPLETIPQENLRFALINIMAYILSFVINEYMITFTKEAGSYSDDKKCRIDMKNEFYIFKILLTLAKKHYASLQKLQEGNYLGEGHLDVKGIDCLVKVGTSKATKDALKKVLLRDILGSEEIDQLQILKDIAIIEKKIYLDLESGKRNYYKPVTIKSINHYKDPLKIQGITASMVWNYVKGNGLPAIDLEERNAIDVVKVLITPATLEKIKVDFPEQYDRFMELVDPTKQVHSDIPMKDYTGKITAIAIPRDIDTPEWVLRLIDYASIINDNISGFPVGSCGISQMDDKKVNYTNVIKL